MKHAIVAALALALVGMMGVAVAQVEQVDQVAVDQVDGAAVAPPACGELHGPPMGPPGGPLMRVLDADKDGALSAEEIANAAAALLTLDLDGDGALSREELMPPPPEGEGPEGFVEFIMGFDADEDGLVTAEELPEHLQHLIELIDTNGDDAIDAEEALAFAEDHPPRPPRREHRRHGGGGGHPPRP
jgi:Ca2+-binding EF-hand superfamily protein